jgi:hypothetical protein
MDLKQLREKGGLVSQTPVVKEVVWTPPSEDAPITFTVHVKKLSFGTIERLFAVDETDPDRSRMAAYISESVLLGDKGKERLTYEDAFQLDSGLAKVLMEAIGAVNGTGGAAAKN